MREGFDTRVLLEMTAGVALDTTERTLVEMRSAGVQLDGEPGAVGLNATPGASVVVGPGEAGLHCEHDQLGPVAGVQLSIARLTWVRTVAGLTTSSSAISSLDRPVATHATISRSRSVSCFSSG